MSENVPKEGFIDYYGVLGVDREASDKEIRMGFLQQAKERHPDAGGSTDGMQLLNKAYQVLTGSTTRAAYNKMYDVHFGRKQDELDLKDDYENPFKKADSAKVDHDDDFLDDMYAEIFDIK